MYKVLNVCCYTWPIDCVFGYLLHCNNSLVSYMEVGECSLSLACRNDDSLSFHQESIVCAEFISLVPVLSCNTGNSFPVVWPFFLCQVEDNCQDRVFCCSILELPQSFCCESMMFYPHVQLDCFIGGTG